MKHRNVFFALISLAGCVLAAPRSDARTLAIDGTVSNQTLTNWNEWLVGGIQNRSTTARDWLLPLNPQANACTSVVTSCGVLATIKGSPTGATTAIAYAVQQDGFHVAATALKSNGNVLQTMNLGSFGIPSKGYVLVVSHLAGSTTTGGTDGGGMTTATLFVAQI